MKSYLWVAGLTCVLFLGVSSRPAQREAIRSLYQSVFEDFSVTGGGELLEVEVAGDWGYFWSTYTLTATPKAGGEPIKDNGKSVFIVRRQPDGSWKIARLIANSDQPPASGG